MFIFIFSSLHHARIIVWIKSHNWDDFYADAYDALDPDGNITVKWDIISWTSDGYIVSLHYFPLKNSV